MVSRALPHPGSQSIVSDDMDVLIFFLQLCELVVRGCSMLYKLRLLRIEVRVSGLDMIQLLQIFFPEAVFCIMRQYLFSCFPGWLRTLFMLWEGERIVKACDASVIDPETSSLVASNTCQSKRSMLPKWVLNLLQADCNISTVQQTFFRVVSYWESRLSITWSSRRLEYLSGELYSCTGGR